MAFKLKVNWKSRRVIAVVFGAVGTVLGFTANPVIINTATEVLCQIIECTA